MTSRLNICGVLTGHIRTLSDLRTGKVQFSDILAFYGLPLLLAIVVYRGFDDELLMRQSTNLLTAVSIIGGFLFALFAYIVGVIDKLIQNGSANVIRNRFAKEIHVNIAYSILISLVSICQLLSMGFIKTSVTGWEVYGKAAALIMVYFVLIHFLFTLVMVVSRVFVVVSSEVDQMN